MADSLNHDQRQSENAEHPSATRRLLSRLIDVALWAAVLGVVGLALLPRNSGPNVGQPASSVTLSAVGESSELSLPGELERPLLIEAFASWCGACKRNAGILTDLDAAREGGKLDVIAVSVDDNIEKARAARDTWPIPVDVFFDQKGDFARNYRVEVLPTYILVGVDGRVKRVTTGNPGASDIRAWLEEGDQ